MTENQKSVPKKKKKAAKKPDPASAVPLEGLDEKTTQKAADKTPKPNAKKTVPSPDPVPTVAAVTDDKEEALTVAPLSGCKVFGQPDVHHKKCRLCKDLEQCLALDVQKKADKQTRPKSEARGIDFIGFQSGSQKSAFALHIAKQPCHMRDIKSAPWNKKALTWYDTLNQLRRNKTEDGKELPLAGKNKDGTMFILEKNLTKEQQAKMKEEVEKFPY